MKLAPVAPIREVPHSGCQMFEIVVHVASVFELIG